MTSNLLAALKSSAAQQSAAIQNNAKMTPLTEAAISGSVSRVQKVLQEDSKVKIDQKDSDGVSALITRQSQGTWRWWWNS